jgi:succinyl-diaminopimelate desuccinylase
VTGAEAALADTLERRYRDLGEPVVRVGDSLVVGAPDADRPTVLLVGHLDTVPPTDADTVAREATLDDGTAVVVGRGTSDMKAGNVVAMHLMEDATLRTASPWSIALLLYAGEEGPASGNELCAVLDAVPWLADAALAVVLEPTDGRVELGCLGGIHARVTFHGAAAHSARPWQGRNALSGAGSFLTALEHRAPVTRVVDGIDFRDVLVATQAWTGGLGPQERGTAPMNVVPDRFTVNVNLRFAPSRDLVTAEQELRDPIGLVICNALYPARFDDEQARLLRTIEDHWPDDGGNLDRLLDASVYFSFDRSGFLRHQRRFDPADLAVTLGGRRFAVTGGNSGLGFALCEGLLRRGAEVALLCRSAERGAAAAARLAAATGRAEPTVIPCDLEDFDSVDAAAEALGSGPLHGLAHNAGLLPDARHLGPTGLEQTVAVHLAGPLRLTTRLRPALRAAQDARMVWVSSGGMYTRRLDLAAQHQLLSALAQPNTPPELALQLAEALAHHATDNRVRNAARDRWHRG